MFRFSLKYFVSFLCLFIIELYIGFYVHDSIVRPYIGDLLVVILIYCFVKSFLDFYYLRAAIGTLIFAYCVEISQYFKIVWLLGLQHNTLARVIMGTSFEWIDMIAYTVGIGIVIFIEKLLDKK